MTATGTTPGPPEPVPRRRRWLQILLIASLALNLLVIGTIAGIAWRFRHPIGAGGPGVAATMLGFAHSLPSERRGAIREIVRNAQPRIGPLRREARQSRGEVARLIAAEPFDRARLEAASARLAEAEGRLRLEGHKLAVEIAAALTPEERSRFSSWRAARRGGWAHRGRGELEEPSDEKQPATKP